MTNIERLAIEQAIYNAIGEDLKTGRTGNLRGEVNEVYLDLYQRTGATGFEVRVNGQKVGTYGFNKVRGQKERTVSELRVTDPDALVAWSDDDFDAWCARWVLDHIEQLAREYAAETGELPDGMELVEVTTPAVPDGINPNGRLRVDARKVAAAMGHELPSYVAGLLEGGA